MKFAPDAMPSARPLCASFWAIRIASPSCALTMASSWSSFTIAGMNSSEMPWMR